MTGRRIVINRDLLGQEEKHGKTWRHPSDPSIVVTVRCAAAVALMQMGIADYRLIAEAVGLDAAAVERIDAAEDRAIRALAVARIPNGEFFKLRVRVQCPGCNGRVYVAPCVFCAQHTAK
jgi:hypothetical protein